MIRNFLLFLILIPAIAEAQFSVKGTLESSNNFSWVLLYKLENGKQEYVENANIENGTFEFKMTSSEKVGIYRAYYQIENKLYVEFIYNKEDIVFTFNPEKPSETISFSASSENKIYQKYHKNITGKQNIIDSLQTVYFQSNNAKTDKKIEKVYKNDLIRYHTVQTHFEKHSKNMLAHYFIKASAQYNAEKPFKKPLDYIAEVKLHFFDAIDFKDPFLNNSTFINDRLNDYVFYLNQANNKNSRDLLQKEAIDNVMKKIDGNFKLLKTFEENILQKYVADENAEMVDFVINHHYNNLPKSYQDAELKYKTTAAMKTAIGKQAADFSWSENGVKNSLYKLAGSDYYIVVFFSATCPHCQIEIPEFHSFIKKLENIKVVSVGLEDERTNWDIMTADFSEFTNVLDLDKWKSKKVTDYGVMAIPSYYILDADKKIIAKPASFEELKEMFEEI